MTTYHIIVEQAEDGWLAAHALEDDSVHTQGKTLEEVAANIREVADLLHGQKQVQLEMILPPDVPAAAAATTQEDSASAA